MLSIEKFCRGSENLKDCRPNIILIVFSAKENRFSGRKSPFYKSLLAFGKLGLIDLKKPNVIVVMTHVCSDPHKNVEKWKSKLEEKSSEVKRLVKETLKVDPPVVFIENMFEDYELEPSKDGQQSKLPDGRWQPNNLFFAITDLLLANGDHLGVETFKHFFGTSVTRKKKIMVGTSVEAKIESEEPLNSKEMAIFNILNDEAVAGTHLPEVATKIQNYVSRKAVILSKVPELIEKYSLLAYHCNCIEIKI